MWMGNGVKCQKDIFIRNCMKCPYLHREVMFAYPNLGRGWGGSQFQTKLFFFARTQMKCVNMHRKATFPTVHSNGDGLGWWSSSTNFCFAQNYKVMFASPPPLRVGVQGRDQFPKQCFGIKWNVQICTDRSCFPTLCPLWEGFGVSVTKIILLVMECNFHICIKKSYLCLPSIPIGVGGLTNMIYMQIWKFHSILTKNVFFFFFFFFFFRNWPTTMWFYENNFSMQICTFHAVCSSKNMLVLDIHPVTTPWVWGVGNMTSVQIQIIMQVLELYFCN